MYGHTGPSDRYIPMTGIDISSYEPLIILKLKKLLNNLYSYCDFKIAKQLSDNFSFRVFIYIKKM